MPQPTAPAADEAAALRPYAAGLRRSAAPQGAAPGRASRTRGARGACLVLGLLISVAACGNDGKETPTGTASPSTTGSSTSLTVTGSSPADTSPSAPRSATVKPPPPATTTKRPVATCVKRTVDAMSQAQRVGQLFMTAVGTSGLTATQAAAITQGKVGAVILTGHTSAGTGPVKSVTDRVGKLVSPVHGSTVRMLVSTDQEGGRVQVLGGPGFSTIPNAVTQGGWSESRLRGSAATWARQLRAAGVNMNLAPVADTVPPNLVTVNEPIGKLDREYGTDPTRVATHSTAFLRGMHDAGVVASAKHFPGLGRVRGNTDLTAGVTDTVTTRTDPYLVPFRSAVQAGVPFVMVSSATYTRIDPSRQAVFSSVVLRGLLRDSLGFQGVIISDDLGNAVAVKDRTPARRALDFFAAGGNMLLTVQPKDIVPMTTAVLNRLPRDAALRRAVDDSVRRVLTAKQHAGLLSCA